MAPGLAFLPTSAKVRRDAPDWDVSIKFRETIKCSGLCVKNGKKIKPIFGDSHVKLFNK